MLPPAYISVQKSRCEPQDSSRRCSGHNSCFQSLAIAEVEEDEWTRVFVCLPSILSAGESWWSPLDLSFLTQGSVGWHLPESAAVWTVRLSSSSGFHCTKEPYCPLHFLSWEAFLSGSCRCFHFHPYPRSSHRARCWCLLVDFWSSLCAPVCSGNILSSLNEKKAWFYVLALLRAVNGRWLWRSASFRNISVSRGERGGGADVVFFWCFFGIPDFTL